MDEFDPNQPFEIVSDPEPEFDPNAPFELAQESEGPREPREPRFLKPIPRQKPGTLSIDQNAADRINVRSGIPLDAGFTPEQLEERNKGGGWQSEIQKIESLDKNLAISAKAVDNVAEQLKALDAEQFVRDPAKYQEQREVLRKRLIGSFNRQAKQHQELNRRLKRMLPSDSQRDSMVRRAKDWNAANPRDLKTPQDMAWDMPGLEGMLFDQGEDGFDEIRKDRDKVQELFEEYLEEARKNPEPTGVYIATRLPGAGGVVSAMDSFGKRDSAKILEMSPRLGFHKKPYDDLEYIGAIRDMAGWVAAMEHEHGKTWFHFKGWEPFNKEGTKNPNALKGLGFLGTRTWDILTMAPGYAVEFALTGGAATGARKAVDKSFVATLRRQANHAMTKRLGPALGAAGKFSLNNTYRAGRFATAASAQTLMNPWLIARNLGHEVEGDINLSVDDSGHLNWKVEGMDMPVDLSRAYAYSVAEIGTERMGEVIARTKAWKQINNTLHNAKSRLPIESHARFDEISRRAGYNGPALEVMEERFNDISTYLYDLSNGREEFTKESLDRRIAKSYTDGQVIAEYVAFSLFGVGMNMGQTVINQKAIDAAHRMIREHMVGDGRWWDNQWTTDEAVERLQSSPELAELQGYTGQVVLTEDKATGKTSAVKVGEGAEALTSALIQAQVNNETSVIRGAFHLKAGVPSEVITAEWEQADGKKSHTFNSYEEALDHARALEAAGNSEAAMDLYYQATMQVQPPSEINQIDVLDPGNVNAVRMVKSRVKLSELERIFDNVRETEDGYELEHSGHRVSVQVAELEWNEEAVLKSLVGKGIVDAKALESATPEERTAIADQYRGRQSGLFDQKKLNGQPIDNEWLIQLNLRADSATFRHETLHFFREVGVISEQEYQRLVDDAVTWDKKAAEFKKKMDQALEEKNQELADTYAEELEERIAYAVEFGAESRMDVESPIIYRARQLLSKLQRMAGYLNTRDLWRDIDTGKFKGRTPELKPAESSGARLSVQGRDPILAAAAQEMRAGKLSGQQYRALVQEIDPILPRTTKPTKPSNENLETYLGMKRAKLGLQERLEPGEVYDFRIDIGTFNRSYDAVMRGELSEPVVAITAHREKNFSEGKSFKAGKALGYGGIAKIKGWATVKQDEDYAERIAAGEPKNTISAISGKYNPSQSIPRNIMAMEQVGYNPIRSSKYYDKNTGQAVLEMLDPIIIGTTVFAKKLKYDPSAPKYSIQNPPDGFGSLESWNRTLKKLETIGDPLTAGAQENLSTPDTPQGALQTLIDSTDSPEIKEAAKTLQKIFEGQRVEKPTKVFIGEENKRGNLGFYASKSDTASVQGEGRTDLVLMHELVHALTSRITNQYVNQLRNAYTRVSGTSYLKRLKSLHDQIISGTRKTKKGETEKITPSGKDLLVARIIDAYLKAVDQVGPKELVNRQESNTAVLSVIKRPDIDDHYRLVISNPGKRGAYDSIKDRHALFRKVLERAGLGRGDYIADMGSFFLTNNAVKILKQKGAEGALAGFEAADHHTEVFRFEFLEKKRKGGQVNRKASSFVNEMGKEHYGYLNIEEFLTEGSTNPAFMMQLAQVDLGPATEVKGWMTPGAKLRDRMSKAVRALLGLYRANMRPSLYMGPGHANPLPAPSGRAPDHILAARRVLKKVQGRHTLLDEVAHIIADFHETKKPGDEYRKKDARYPMYSVQAAKAAGFTVEASHGTYADFNVFEASEGSLGMHFGTERQAWDRLKRTSPKGMEPPLDVLSKEDLPKGAKVIPVYLKLNNPLRLKDKGDWSAASVGPQLVELGITTLSELEDFNLYDSDSGLWYSGDEAWQEIITDAGYDGVVYENRFEATTGGFRRDPSGDSYIVFSPNQIKSADPVTYDDAGNVIPLSERFQPSSNDIRYSVQGAEDEFEFTHRLRQEITGGKSDPRMADALVWAKGKLEHDTRGEALGEIVDILNESRFVRDARLEVSDEAFGPNARYVDWPGHPMDTRASHLAGNDALGAVLLNARVMHNPYAMSPSSMDNFAAEVLIHEASHALMYRAINNHVNFGSKGNSPEMTARIKNLESILGEARGFYNRETGENVDFKSREGNIHPSGELYGLTNIHEFVAELTKLDSKLVDILGRMPAKRGEVSLLERAKQTVADLFKAVLKFIHKGKDSSMEGTAFNDAISDVLFISKEAAKGEGAERAFGGDVGGGNDIRYSMQGGFKVQQLMLDDSGKPIWIDAPWQVDGMPHRFKTREEAQEEIDELIRDTREEGMEDYSAEDYRVVEDGEWAGSYSIQGEQPVSNIPSQTQFGQMYSRVADAIEKMPMKKATFSTWMGRLKKLSRSVPKAYGMPKDYPAGERAFDQEELEQLEIGSLFHPGTELTKEEMLAAIKAMPVPEITFTPTADWAALGTKYEGMDHAELSATRDELVNEFAFANAPEGAVTAALDVLNTLEKRRVISSLYGLEGVEKQTVGETAERYGLNEDQIEKLKNQAIYVMSDTTALRGVFMEAEEQEEVKLIDSIISESIRGTEYRDTNLPGAKYPSSGLGYGMITWQTKGTQYGQRHNLKEDTVAHTRFNFNDEQVDLIESQSDLHQLGANKGYKDPTILDQWKNTKWIEEGERKGYGKKEAEEEFEQLRINYENPKNNFNATLDAYGGLRRWGYRVNQHNSEMATEDQGWASIDEVYVAEEFDSKDGEISFPFKMVKKYILYLPSEDGGSGGESAGRYDSLDEAINSWRRAWYSRHQKDQSHLPAKVTHSKNWNELNFRAVVQAAAMQGKKYVAFPSKWQQVAQIEGHSNYIDMSTSEPPKTQRIMYNRMVFGTLAEAKRLAKRFGSKIVKRPALGGNSAPSNEDLIQYYSASTGRADEFYHVIDANPEHFHDLAVSMYGNYQDPNSGAGIEDVRLWKYVVNNQGDGDVAGAYDAVMRGENGRMDIDVLAEIIESTDLLSLKHPKRGSVLDFLVREFPIKYGKPIMFNALEITPEMAGPIARYSIQSKLPNLNTHEFFQSPLAIEGTGKNGRISINDVAEALEAYTLGKHKKPLTDDELGLAAMFVNAKDEVAFQLEQPVSGRDFYHQDQVVLEKYLQKVYPELKQKHNMVLFKALLSPTSFGQNPKNNVVSTTKIWESGKPGNLQPYQPGGKGWTLRAGIVAGMVEMHNRLVQDMGPKKAAKWLTSKQFIGNRANPQPGTLRYYNNNVSGKEGDKVLGGYIWGPKGGPFFFNNIGIQDKVTMDMWFSRSWNRIMGTLIENGEIVEAPRNDAERDTMIGVVDKLSKDLGLTHEEVQAVWWFYEQQLWQALGANVKSLTFVDGAEAVLESKGIQPPRVRGYNRAAAKGRQAAQSQAISRGGKRSVQVSPEAQARINHINAAGAHLPPEPEVAPAYGSSYLSDFQKRYLARASQKLIYFAGPKVGQEKTILQIEEAYSAAAVRKSQDELVRRLTDDAYESQAGIKLPKWMRVGKWATRLNEFLEKSVPLAAHLNATSRDAKGNFVFTDFEMRSGLMKEKDFNSGNHQVGDRIMVVNSLTGENDELVIGSFISTPDGRTGYQLQRVMTAERQEEIFNHFKEEFPDLIWAIEMYIDPALKGARQVVNGVEIPIFNRFSMEEMMGESDAGFKAVAGYTPDVVATKSLIGGILGLFNPGSGTRSPGRKYKTGKSRETGNVQDLFSGHSIRSFQMLQEKHRQRFRDAVLKHAARPLEEGEGPNNLPEGWVMLDAGMNDLIQRVKQYRQFFEDESVDGTEFYKKFLGKMYAERGRQLKIRREAVEVLMQQYVRIQFNNKLYNMGGWLIRNSKGMLLAHPGTMVVNAATNDLFTFEAAFQEFLKGISLLPVSPTEGKTSLRAAKELMVGNFLHRFPSLRRLAGLTSHYDEVVGEAIPEELFASSVSLQDLDVKYEVSAGQYLREGELGAAALQLLQYGNIDVRAKQRMTYAFLKSHAVQQAKNQGLKGEAMRSFADRYMKNPPRDILAKAVDAANLEYLNYADSPAWLQWFAATPYTALIMPFPRFGYHFLAKQITKAAAVKDVITKVPAEKRADAFGKLMAFSMFGLGGAGVILDMLLRDDDDDEEARERIGTNYVKYRDPMTGDVRTKQLDREMITTARVNISWYAEKMGLGTESEEDFWMRVRNYPMVAMAGNAILAESDAREHGAWEGSKTYVRNTADLSKDFFSLGAGLKVPSKVWAEMTSEPGSPKKVPAADPYATNVPLSFYLVEQSSSTFIPGTRQMNDLSVLINPERPKKTASKSLGYEPGAWEAVRANHLGAVLSRLAEREGLIGPMPRQGSVVTMSIHGNKGDSLERRLQRAEGLGKLGGPEANIFIDPQSYKPRLATIPESSIPNRTRRLELLRIMGLNLKPVQRGAYEQQIKPLPQLPSSGR